MRNVSIQELEADAAGLIAEVEAGQRLTLIRGGRAVADIVPHADVVSGSETRHATAEKMTHGEAVEQLMTTLEKGFDLGGFKITNRDELYERD